MERSGEETSEVHGSPRSQQIANTGPFSTFPFKIMLMPWWIDENNRTEAHDEQDETSHGHRVERHANREPIQNHQDVCKSACDVMDTGKLITY